MHQNGKEDSTTGANAFSSNTFPLLSRSSMKRPFSLSSEREHQAATIRDHFRCRGFRSRSKTIHSDTFVQRPCPHRDLLGQFNALTGPTSHHGPDRSAIMGMLDSGRRKPPTLGNLSSETLKSHLVMPESILDEEMTVDEEEDENESHLTMLPQSEQTKVAPVVDRQVVASLDMLKNQNTDKLQAKLDFNSNPSAALCSSAKSKVNLLLGHTVPLCCGQMGGHAGHGVNQSSIVPKVATTFAPKPTADCDETNQLLNPRAEPPGKALEGADQLLDSSKGPTPRLAIQNSLSPLAVPKSATSQLESKALALTAATAHIPTEAEKAQFQRSLDSATTLVFHRRSGLPLTSSPAPIRKCGTSFDFDSSLTSVNAIKKALFEKDTRDSISSLRSRVSFSAPTTTSALLGNFEESVLNGRLEPASIVNGFTAEIGASGTFCPKHKTLPVTVFFYALQDSDKGEKISSPYLGHINLGPKGYHVPRQGTVQVTLFNPNGTVVKMFVVRYDLSDMPPNSRTFLRQRTLFMPSDANEHHPDNRKWLRYLIHLRFQSSKSGRIRLHTDIRILVFRKHDLDVATLNGGVPYELRSFVQMPSNPKYSKNIKS